MSELPVSFGVLVCAVKTLYMALVTNLAPREGVSGPSQTAGSTRKSLHSSTSLRKGRPLIIASQHNFAQLIASNYSSKLCKIATANLKKLNISPTSSAPMQARFEFPERTSSRSFTTPSARGTQHGSRSPAMREADRCGLPGIRPRCCARTHVAQIHGCHGRHGII